jgi:hypothetical protein
VGATNCPACHVSPSKLKGLFVDQQIGRHSTMKTKSDAERFGSYQTVIHALLTRHPFHKKDLYPDLDGVKKAFMFVLSREGIIRTSQIVTYSPLFCKGKSGGIVI